MFKHTPFGFPRPLLLAALCLLAGCAAPGGGAASAPATPATLSAGGLPAGWKLAWADEFAVDGLPDAGKWDYDTSANRGGWYNHELQYYARARLDNARVSDGRLVLTARKEKLATQGDYGGQAYSSARLYTRGIAQWKYGFIEVRAKLPCGRGTWPAIWMLGTEGGAWPAMGEIDIMEHVGRKQGEVLGTIHTSAYNHAIHTQKGEAIMVPDACGAFHNYQLTWTADAIRIGVDNKNYFEFANPGDGDKRKWPFDSPQYLILNVAVGGDLGGPVDDAIFPVQMEVDYVRVYQP
jgi:beta-glucanase (GH16 family)